MNRFVIWSNSVNCPSGPAMAAPLLGPRLDAGPAPRAGACARWRCTFAAEELVAEPLPGTLLVAKGNLPTIFIAEGNLESMTFSYHSITYPYDIGPWRRPPPLRRELRGSGHLGEHIQVSKNIQVFSKIQVFKQVQVFVHKSKVVNCQDSTPPATKDGGTRGGGP